MLVVVKKPHTKKPEIEIRGKIPAWILGGLEKEYGKNLSIVSEDDTLYNIEETDWYNKMQVTDTPDRSLRVYRARNGFSLAELGKMIGASRQNVHEMEKGKRGISKEMAKKLARIFHVPVGEFI